MCRSYVFSIHMYLITVYWLVRKLNRIRLSKNDRNEQFLNNFKILLTIFKKYLYIFPFISQARVAADKCAVLYESKF